MQLIKQNLIKAILGLVVSLVVGAGIYFGSSDSLPLMNIRKLYDSSVTYFDEESHQEGESKIVKPETPSSSQSPNQTASPTATPTETPKSTLQPRPTAIPSPTTITRAINTPTPTLTTTRRTTTPYGTLQEEGL